MGATRGQVEIGMCANGERSVVVKKERYQLGWEKDEDCRGYLEENIDVQGPA